MSLAVNLTIAGQKDQIVTQWYKENTTELLKESRRSRIDTLKNNFISLHTENKKSSISLFSSKNKKINQAQLASTRLQLFTMWQIEKSNPNKTSAFETLINKEAILLDTLTRLNKLSELLVDPKAKNKGQSLAKECYELTKTLYHLYKHTDSFPLKDYIEQDFKALKSL